MTGRPAEFPEGRLSVRGRLAHDKASRSAAGQDFGRVVRQEPWAVFRPESAEDVSALVRFAAAQRRAVAPRGRGHSTFGQAQAADGIVLDLSGLRAVHEVGPDFVDVDAGASWRSVVLATVPRGLTPPVLTDYLGLSVGGTLSVGGVGGVTHRHGMQTDNVLRLDVVTGDGVARTCSAHTESTLFHAVLGGLGQCGVITRARLRLVPAPARVRRYKLYYATPRRLTADQRRLLASDRFPYLEGQLKPDASGWRPRLEAASFFSPPELPLDESLLDDLGHERGSEEIEDLSYVDFVDRLTSSEADLRATGEWFHPHPWWNAFLPGSTVDDLVEEVAARVTPDDIGAGGALLLYPFTRRRLTTPLVRTPDDPVVFLFAILRTAPPDQPTAVEEIIRLNRALYEQVRAAGGTRYPVGTVPFDRADWVRHFGTAWPSLHEAKERYDPHHVLTPGQGIF
ncbi:FAD-binding protein [Streptoalloteichus hindustanus]|uniref:FAD/FMN-containing dehydrogenase n=1 Tax=Streptoalloteichus hindustanus TaxID=2017 RepID=A0A1M5F1Z9_STRHI|nr:FAD-binding protein [Streptoalloteichus hindustanus]SHF85563.1 FAD/FMN-containing dehydrogenase [Streptoalloteichus hindustanus]